MARSKRGDKRKGRCYCLYCDDLRERMSKKDGQMAKKKQNEEEVDWFEGCKIKTFEIVQAEFNDLIEKIADRQGFTGDNLFALGFFVGLYAKTMMKPRCEALTDGDMIICCERRKGHKDPHEAHNPRGAFPIVWTDERNCLMWRKMP